MTTIKSIVISTIDIDHTPQEVFNILQKLNILTANRITMVKYTEWSSYIRSELEFYRAYVEIDEWFDNDYANQFIHNLKSQNEQKIIYSENPYDTWWTVSINYNVDITNILLYKDNTTVFYLVDKNDTFIYDSGNKNKKKLDIVHKDIFNFFYGDEVSSVC
jgi:hypothetical protein